MAKRNTEWTEAKIARYIKDGRGSGELNYYKPWLTNQDFASKGRTHRIKSWKTNRMTQLFSDLELNYFLILDWSDTVFDIREQFPLDREITLKIAEDKQIKHSVYDKNKTPIVMTTDFLITLKTINGFEFIARTLKYSNELNDKRTIEKLEIEREYWKDKGVSWGIVTEKDIPKILSTNIQYLHSSYYLDVTEVEWTELLIEYIKHSNGTIIQSIKNFETNYMLDKGTGLKLLKHLVANKRISLNMLEKIDLRLNVSELKVLEVEGSL